MSKNDAEPSKPQKAGNDNDDDDVAAKKLVPVTYYPLATQKHFQRMRAMVLRKPYAKFWNDTLYLYPDVLPALKQPMSRQDVLPLAEASRLLESGYHNTENGWVSLSDGTAYVASKTRFPGATGPMLDWWFWWHAVEPERYALWYPYNHVAAVSSFAHRLRPGDENPRVNWLGSTHTVTEFIGRQFMSIRIKFVEPGVFGLPWDKLAAAGYAAAVCAVLWHAWLPMKVGEFVHLWRETDDGLELRSRYWLGHNVQLRLLGGFVWIPLDFMGGLTGIKQRLAGENIAYEQYLHDQTEFTNLGRILPALYREFGPGSS